MQFPMTVDRTCQYNISRYTGVHVERIFYGYIRTIASLLMMEARKRQIFFSYFGFVGNLPTVPPVLIPKKLSNICQGNSSSFYNEGNL